MRRSIEITQPMIDAYGAINGDNDIVHYDPEYALARGFRGTLLHGPHMTALTVDLAAAAHGADWLRRGRLATKWVGPVCPGDTLVVTLDEGGSLEASTGHGVTLMR